VKISIAQRIRPFSHLPGTCSLLPFTRWQLQVFPTLLKFRHVDTSEEQFYALGWKGPVRGFTVQLNLEKGIIEIYGHTVLGYRRAQIRRVKEGIEISLEKEQTRVILSAIPDPYLSPSFPKERLSLGMSKLLDWDLVRRRLDLREIFPVWLRLGQMCPFQETTDSIGPAAFLRECQKEEVISHYLNFFLVGFHSLFVPRLKDTEHQGIIGDEEASSSSISLLSKGASLIRSLFFKEVQDSWFFLPELSVHFPSGRFIGIHTICEDQIDMEWSKKNLRRLIISSGQSRRISLHLPGRLKSYRIRHFIQDKGHRQNADHPLILIKNQKLLLDRFEE